MAEEATIQKRKYEDQTTPLPPPSATRRATGFSAPIVSQSPDSGHAPPSYNSVPPPVDEIQLAKQRAQEIAARIFNNVEAKRPRVENGGGGGFDSNDNLGQKPLMSNVNPLSIPVSYGFQGTSKKIDIPSGRVGVIIGKGGETIKYLQLQSGAKIQVTRDMDADPNSPNRMVELMGTQEQIVKAEQLINDVLAEAETGGSGVVSRRLPGQQAGAEQFVMEVPNNKVGLIIGKGGETIKNMQARSGARIQVIPLHLPPGDISSERTVKIDGTNEQIESAKQLVNEVISENRIRNPTMAGVYPQQDYQARPPTSWAPPGPPMQQPGYGYVQPGAYPGPSPQYGVSQPAYAAYPAQPTSGGYATGWDETTAPANQQISQGGGYDYYSQPPPQQQQATGGPSAPADNTGYGYNQQGQPGYPQDGYGGGYHAPAPQPGYGQPQPNPHTAYDQQEGYNSTPGYGNVTNPTPEGHAPSYGAQGDANQAPPPVQTGQQGYTTGQQPSPSPASYQQQGSTQPGYGTSQTGYGTQPPGYGPSYGPPQAQKPPGNQLAYGQPQQSPSAQGGYVQSALVQPGYPHSQPPPAQTGYYQPDSAAQRAPPSSYGTAAAQPGYGPPPYGAPVTQPAYGQPPVYSAADAAAAAASQPSGVAKASPQG
uniref:K Homology domain-containing protein n=2 Tax=Davidia involucrata TaxID=16924 RepID=A0A5B6ZHN7_DAVIN